MILLTDIGYRQTDRQCNRLRQIHNILGRGKAKYGVDFCVRLEVNVYRVEKRINLVDHRSSADTKDGSEAWRGQQGLS